MGCIRKASVLKRAWCLGLMVMTGWGCAASPGPVTADVNPPPVFIAKDFQYEGPDVVTGGLVKVHLHNHGTTIHHIQLLRLSQGKTPDELFQALEANPGEFPSWTHFVGGPNAVNPNAGSSAIMDLQEGWYVLLCWVEDTTGKPHYQRGMVKTLQVISPGGEPSAVPASNLTVDQVDFGFVVPQHIQRGATTIKVKNNGHQPHELVLVELDPGSTMADWLKNALGEFGPPPGRPVGGITGLDQGGHGFFDAEFHEGRYGLICFFTDKETKSPHFMRGMMWEFDVK